MFKLIKYEIKTISKEFLIVLAAIVFLNLALMTRINVWQESTLTMLSFLICFGASVVAFIYNITIFTRDLKQDTGYLLFSIPKSGYSILGAKLISSLIVIIVSTIVGGIMTFLLVIVAMGNFNDFVKALTQFKSMANVSMAKVTLVLIIDAIISILMYVYLLLTIYFSISTSRAIMNKRKFSGLVSFLIFISINLITGKIYEVLANAIPKTINPYFSLIDDTYMHSANTNDPFMLLLPVNWAGGIFNIIVMVALFIGIGYILEKKIDL